MPSNPSSESQRTVLVVDSDNDFLTSIKIDPKASSRPPVLASNGKEAQLVLSDRNRPLLGVFVNLNVKNTDGISVIRAAHLHRPALPIYLLCDGAPELSPQELSNLSIQEALSKPLTYFQLLEIVNPAALIFDKDAALTLAKNNSDKLDAVADGTDNEFTPIRADGFLSGSKCFFDVYVRLGTSRYVKILQAGDNFLHDRILNYVKKGVVHFYLRKEAQERYLAYCDQLASALISKPQVPLSIVVTQTLNHGTETINFLRSNGLSDTSIQYANKFVENVSALSKSMRFREHPAIASFMTDIAAYEHGIATSMFASLLIGPMNIQHDKPVQIFGIAALLHDIALYSMDEALRDEDESKMTPEQLKEYHTHPAKSAEILSGIRGINPSAVQAVEQHHRRRNKRGFGHTSGSAPMGRVAEVIGLADEIARLAAESKKDSKIDVMKEIELNVCPGFSQSVVQAFYEGFLNRKG